MTSPPPGRSPVPAGMRLRPDPGLLTLAGGTVLVGGSPLRLLRLSPRGAALARGWWDGVPVPGQPAAQKLARRLLDAGLAHPDPAGGPPGPGPDEVTAVIPVRDRPAELASCLAGLDGMRVIVVDDGSADPPAVAAAAAAAGALCLRRDRCGGRAPPGTPASPPCARRWSPSSTPTASRGRAGSRRCCGISPTPRSAPWRPGSWRTSRAAAGWRGMRSAASALDMGPAESIVRPGARVPYVPGAALLVRRAAAAGGFAEDMPVGEDVNFVWRLAAAGWHIRYEPRAAVGHRHRVRLGDWLRRRRDYGTSAAPLELRHPGTVPACAMSGWSALAWAAAAAGQPVTGAAITGAAAALLARRLGPLTDDAWPLAGRLAGRGTLAAGRLLGSAVARTWWPLALPAAAADPAAAAAAGGGPDRAAGSRLAAAAAADAARRLRRRPPPR